MKQASEEVNIIDKIHSPFLSENDNLRMAAESEYARKAIDKQKETLNLILEQLKSNETYETSIRRS